jgi:transcriptional regulator with XRE-family HTH domain
MHRLQHNWTQSEMAARTGLSIRAYQGFESGYGNITLANLMRVLGALGFAHHVADLVPPVTTEPTFEELARPESRRARAPRSRK